MRFIALTILLILTTLFPIFSQTTTNLSGKLNRLETKLLLLQELQMKQQKKVIDLEQSLQTALKSSTMLGQKVKTLQNSLKKSSKSLENLEKLLKETKDDIIELKKEIKKQKNKTTFWKVATIIVAGVFGTIAIMK